MTKSKKIAGYIGCVTLVVGTLLPILEQITSIPVDGKITIALLVTGLILVGAPVKDLIEAWRADE